MNSEQTSMRVLGLRTGAAALVFVLAGGCATTGSLAITKSDSAGAGAAKGAVGGAGVCLLPAYGGGVVGGPIGLMIGGAVSLACLPFGLVIGAVVGADQAGPLQQHPQEQPRPQEQLPQPPEHEQAQLLQEYGWAQEPQEHEQAQQLQEQQQPLRELQRHATDSSNPIALLPPAQVSDQGALADPAKAQTTGLPQGLPAPGTSWIYGFVDRMFRGQQEVTVRVLRTDGAVIEEAVTANAQGAKAAQRVVDTREPRFLEHALGGSALLIEIAPYLLAAHEGKGTPQIQGATGYPHGHANLAPWVVTARERGWERLTVPAGTFQALRVELDGRREREVSAHGQTGRFSITAWYSPEVKRLVKVEHKTWPTSVFDRGGAQNGHDVLELVAYRPPS